MTNEEYKQLFNEVKHRNAFLEYTNKAVQDIDEILTHNAIKGIRGAVFEMLPYKRRYGKNFDMFMALLEVHYSNNGFNVETKGSKLKIQMKDTPGMTSNKDIVDDEKQKEENCG